MQGMEANKYAGNARFETDGEELGRLSVYNQLPCELLFPSVLPQQHHIHFNVKVKQKMNLHTQPLHITDISGDDSALVTAPECAEAPQMQSSPPGI